MKFIALKPARVASLSGHCVFMEANEERDLYGELAKEAMAHPDVVPAETANALVEAATAARIAAEEAAAKENAEADEADDVLEEAKKAELVSAIEQLIAGNIKENFTAQGYPRVAAVIDILGREDVGSAEIREAFDAMSVGE